MSDFFEICEARLRKAEEFFDNPSVSLARKELKRAEYNRLCEIVSARTYFSEVVGKKFKILSDFVLFENGVEISFHNIARMEKMSAEQVRNLFNVFCVFERSVIL